MKEPNESLPEAWGTYRRLHEMIDDLATLSGLHTDKQFAAAFKNATGLTLLEKNVRNWRKGNNLPSASMLKPLADTLGITGNPRREAVWNRLYAEEVATRSAKRAQTDPPSTPLPPVVSPPPVPINPGPIENGGPNLSTDPEPDPGPEPPSKIATSPEIKPPAPWRSPKAVAVVGVAMLGLGLAAFRFFSPQGPAAPTYLEKIPPWELPTSPEGFVLAESATRLLTLADIEPLSGWRLYVARNEIYARYGRTFQRAYSVCLQQHFNTWARGGTNPRGWYVPVSGEPRPSQLELDNAAFIAKYECDVRAGQFLCDGKLHSCSKPRPPG